jgi:hypothetical protein
VAIPLFAHDAHLAFNAFVHFHRKQVSFPVPRWKCAPTRRDILAVFQLKAPLDHFLVTLYETVQSSDDPFQ